MQNKQEDIAFWSTRGSVWRLTVLIRFLSGRLNDIAAICERHFPMSFETSGLREIYENSIKSDVKSVGDLLAAIEDFQNELDPSPLVSQIGKNLSALRGFYSFLSAGNDIVVDKGGE